MSGPLDGVRVLDLTQGWAGPFCTMELGDLGADVVKVEPPEGDFTRRLGPPFLDGESLPYLAVNRSKRGIVLDLSSPNGLAVVRRLAASADVMVESFEPGEADRLGIGYDAVTADNPALIYATVTGFGQTGPYRDRAASELVLQAMSGVFEPQRDEPKKALGGEAVGIFTAKYLLHGILAALVQRQRTGVGQRVDVAMLEAALARTMTLWPTTADTGASTAPPPAIWGMGDRSFATSDQRIEFNFRVNGYTPNDEAWKSFFHDVGAHALADDPRFATEADRTANFLALRAALEPHLATKRAAEVVELVSTYGGMVALWNDLGSALAHPQAEALDMTLTLEHPSVGTLRTTAPPYEFQGSPLDVHRAPPTLGQHTDEVLQELGV